MAPKKKPKDPNSLTPGELDALLHEIFSPLIAEACGFLEYTSTQAGGYVTIVDASHSNPLVFEFAPVCKRRTKAEMYKPSVN